VQLVLASLLFISGFATAVDRDDLYVETYVGSQIDGEARIQLGAAAGYALFDSVGFGLMLDQSFPNSKNDDNRGSFLIGAEGRWFIEPFEVSGVVGIATTQFLDRPDLTTPFIMPGANYLVAISASMAIRLGFRGYVPFKSEASHLIGDLGIRFVF